MNQKIDDNKITYGTPFIQTDLRYNKKPFIASDLNTDDSTRIISPDKLKDTPTFGTCTYSFWIYIVGNQNIKGDEYSRTWTNYRYDEWKCIMYRGPDSSTYSSMIGITPQFPSFWLSPQINNLVVSFKHNGVQNAETLQYNNIEFNKWIQITLTIDSNSATLFVNGKYETNKLLDQSIYSMSNYNLYLANDITTNNNKIGFPGFLSFVTYYPYVLTPDEIQKSYSFYKNYVDNYQNNLMKGIPWKPTKVVTNSDCSRKP